MTKMSAVQSSGASLSAAGRSRPQVERQASVTRPTARTIVETAACPAELKRGDQSWAIADFKVQKMLGEGNMSSVVHCICAHSGVHVAVKMYHRDRMNAMNVKQVSREIEIHASLLHPNIVRLFAAFEDADGIYLVQEYAARGDLYVELSRRGGYLPEPQVVKGVLIPFLSALTYMHTQGVLHRDIKPENIMLGAAGDIKVGDFGLAINTTREKPMSRVGTLDYMPPEIVRLPYGSQSGAKQAVAEEGGAAYGLPVDAWCVGVLAFELLVGAPPFEAESKDATYTRILKLEPALPTHLSDQARDFIRQGLQKDPSKRPTVHTLMRHPWLRQYQRPKSLALLETNTSRSAAAAAARPSSPPNASQAALAAAAQGDAEQGTTEGARPSGSSSPPPAKLAAPAAPAAPAEREGGSRIMKSLSFGSAMAGRFSEVKPSKPAGFNALVHRQKNSASPAAAKGVGAGASKEDASRAGRRRSSNGAGASRLQTPATAGEPTQQQQQGPTVRFAGDKPMSREAMAAAAVAETDAERRAATGGGGKGASGSDRVIIRVQAAAGSHANAAQAAAAGGNQAGSVSAAAAGGDDLIRAVAAAALMPGGMARGSQHGSGPRASFAAAIKRRISAVGGGIFGPAAPTADSNGKDDTSAVALALAAAGASTTAAASTSDGGSSGGSSSGAMGGGSLGGTLAGGSSMGAIAALQAPSMQQLLSPQRAQQSAALGRSGSLKRGNSSAGRLLNAFGRFSIGSRKSAAGKEAAALAAAMAAAAAAERRSSSESAEHVTQGNSSRLAS